MSNSDIKVFIKHELAPESCDGGLPQSTAVQNVDPLNIKYEAMEIKEEAGDPEFSENNSYLGPQVLDFVKKEDQYEEQLRLDNICHNNEEPSLVDIKDESIDIGPELIMEYQHSNITLVETVPLISLSPKTMIPVKECCKDNRCQKPLEEQPSAESCNDDPSDHHRSLKCKFCEKLFKFESDLVRHCRTHTGERPFACDKCSKRFPSKSHLNVHLQSHTGERPHTCADCGESFPRKFSLMRHQRIHTGERPFHCDQCGQSFTQKNILKCHKQKHSGDRPFKCDLCDKAFSRRVYLQSHRQSGHVSADDSNQTAAVVMERLQGNADRCRKCKECGQEFVRRSHLVVHLRSHTGERPFKCEDCEQSFSQHIGLVRHRRTHTGERPFQCDECGRTFNQKIVLIRHKRRHLQKLVE